MLLGQAGNAAGGPRKQPPGVAPNPTAVGPLSTHPIDRIFLCKSGGAESDGPTTGPGSPPSELQGGLTQSFHMPLISSSWSPAFVSPRCYLLWR